MATMLVTAIAAPQPTYSTSSTCQLIIVTLSMSSIVVMWVLSMCGLRSCCLRRVQKYVTALSRSRPRPRPGGTICGGKGPALLPCRVVSSRVVSSRATCAVEKRHKWQLFSNYWGVTVNRLGDTVLWFKKLIYWWTNDSKSFTTGKLMIKKASLLVNEWFKKLNYWWTNNSKIVLWLPLFKYDNQPVCALFI